MDEESLFVELLKRHELSTATEDASVLLEELKQVVQSALVTLVIA